MKVQLIFPSKPNFCNCFEFPTTKPTQKEHLPHLIFEICEINSIKSNSLKVFQQHNNIAKF